MLDTHAPGMLRMKGNRCSFGLQPKVTVNSGQLPSFLTRRVQEQKEKNAKRTSISWADDDVTERAASQAVVRNKKHFDFLERNNWPNLSEYNKPNHPPSITGPPSSMSSTLHLSQAPQSSPPPLVYPTVPTFTGLHPISPSMNVPPSACISSPKPVQLRPTIKSASTGKPRNSPTISPQSDRDLLAQEDELLICEDVEEFDLSMSLPNSSDSSSGAINTFKPPEGIAISAEEAQVSRDCFITCNN